MDQHDLLYKMARRYLWWQTPEEASARPKRIMAQVMNLGDYDDVLTLVRQVGEDALRDVIASAQAGWFNERSWHYWHYRLGLSEPEEAPPMPARRFR